MGVTRSFVEELANQSSIEDIAPPPEALFLAFYTVPTALAIDEGSIETRVMNPQKKVVWIVQSPPEGENHAYCGIRERVWIGCLCISVHHGSKKLHQNKYLQNIDH